MHARTRVALLLLCSVLGFPQPGYASPATDWLQQQAQSDGRYQAGQALATPQQATEETLRALRARGLHDADSTDAARTFLTSEPASTTEGLARQIRVVVDQDGDPTPYLTRLEQHQNRDGGFGDRPGYTSNVLDTAWALDALARASGSHGEPVRDAVTFLTQQQRADGSWATDDSASLYTTALALRSLHAQRHAYDLTGPIALARAFLVDRASTDGAGLDVWQTAAALLAIAPTAPSEDLYADIAASLRESQRQDGSWDGRVFATALAVQSLALVEQPHPNPDRGGLRLRLADAATGDDLAGVEVSLSGASVQSAVTTEDGQLAVDGLLEGHYRIESRPTGYMPLDTEIAITSGEVKDLGTIELLRSRDDGSGHISGVVSDSAGDPIAGATVLVRASTPISVRTDNAGQFFVPGVAPGAVSVDVTADGFQSKTLSVDVVGEETSHVAVLLKSVPSDTFGVAGRVTSAADGAPVAAAEITVTGAANASAQTGADGSYQIADLEPGQVTVVATADGFGDVSAQFDAEAATEYRFSPALPGSGSGQTGGTAALTGTVVDSVTGEELNGVPVSITADSETHSATTDGNGVFLAEGLSGDSATIVISPQEYEPKQLQVGLSQGVTVDIGGVELTPDGGTSTISITKRVFDIETEEPIAGAEVESVYPGMSDSAVTDSDGRFTVSVLASRNGTFHLSASGYDSSEFPVYFTSPNDGLKQGDIYLWPKGLVTLQPDLSFERVEFDEAVTDSDLFEYDGRVNAVIRNIGRADVTEPFSVAAFATGMPEQGESLGEVRIEQEIPTGEAIEVSVPVSGAVDFRDAPITLAIDHGAEVAESDERNNRIGSAVRCFQFVPDCALPDPESLHDWTVDRYPGWHGGRPSVWQIRDGGTQARLVRNYDASMLLSGDEIGPGDTIVGTLRTTYHDDDWMGFVWGYQDHNRSYSFRWRKGQPKRLQVIRYEPGEGEHPASTVLVDEPVGWERHVRYRYLLSLHEDFTRIVIAEGDEIIKSIIVEASGYGAGRFGFYNLSQSHSYYRAYRVNPADQVDVTAGHLTTVDNGAAEAPSLRVRIGNAGGKASPEGTQIAFYSGDPQTGELLSTQSLDAIPSGEFVDVETDGLSGLVGDRDVYVVVDPDDLVAELRESNNRDSAAPVAPSRLGSVQVSTDAMAYAPGATVEVTSEAENDGRFPGKFRVNLRIEDAAGDVVSPLGTTDLGELAATERGTAAADWPSPGIVAGTTYTAVAVLRAGDGSVADTDQTTFVIRSGEIDQEAASLTVDAEQAVYERDDSVGIQQLAHNLSPNLVLNGAAVTTVVRDPDGMERWRETTPLNLAPGSTDERRLVRTHTAAAEGVWMVEGILTDAQGAILAEGSDFFEVRESPLRNLSGTVTAAHAHRYIGEDQACTDTLVHTGSAEREVELRQSLLDRTRGEVVTYAIQSVPLAGDATRTLERSVATEELEPGTYTCLLQLRAEGDWVELDSTDFVLEEPPIDIQATLETGDRGRLLVLLDPPNKHKKKNKGDPYGPKGSPDPEAQRAWLEDRLDEAGWSYRIVTQADSFAEALRSKGYAAVAIFSERVKLAEDVQRDLVRAVEQGTGLVVGGMHDRRNGRIEEALGLKSKGRVPHATGLRLYDSEIATADAIELALGERPVCLDPAGARALGIYRVERKRHCGQADDDSDEDNEDDRDEDDRDEDDRDEDDRDEDDRDENDRRGEDDEDDDAGRGKHKGPLPALTTHRHGSGRAVAAGFDLLLQGTAAAGANRYGDLLLAALDHVHPDAIDPVVGRVLPLRLTLVNQGFATPGRALIALPPDAELVDPGAAGVDEIGGEPTLVWPFDLGLDEQRRLDVWVRLPEGAGPAAFTAIIETGESGAFEEHRRVTYEVTVAPER